MIEGGNYQRNIIDNLVYTDAGHKTFSFLVGLALALLFNRVCKSDCTVYYAPHSEEFLHKQFKLEDTCYEYTPYLVDCKNKQDILLPYNIGQQPENKIKIHSKLVS